MINKAVSILLLFSFMIILFRFSIPVATYYVDYDYIVKELCVNRNNPHSDCNGSCQLKKMMKKQHGDAEQTANTTKRTAPRVDYFYSSLHNFYLPNGCFSSQFSLPNDELESQFVAELLSPPPQYA